MPAGDPVLERELKALQDDVSTAQRRRRSRRDRPTESAPAPAPTEIAAKPQPPDGAEEDSSEARKLHEQLRELLDEATGIFDEAERSIATHPAAAVLGALVVGILIGRLLGRR